MLYQETACGTFLTTGPAQENASSCSGFLVMGLKHTTWCLAAHPQGGNNSWVRWGQVVQAHVKVADQRWFLDERGPSYLLGPFQSKTAN